MPRGKIAFDESGIPIPKPADVAATVAGALTAAAAAAALGAAGDAARVAAIVAAGFAATLAGAAAYDAWSATAERQPQPQKAKEPEKACKKTCSEDWKRRNLYYDEVRMGRKKSGKRSWL